MGIDALKENKCKIVIDTDIGGDVDDAFAVALALKTEEIEALGITTVYKNAALRTKILKQELKAFNKEEIPVYVGADDADGFGTGYKKYSAAYVRWIDEMRKRFPSVIFEGCSSGGMRTDYKTLSRFSVVSTSDQTDYKKYLYIGGERACGGNARTGGGMELSRRGFRPIGTVYEPTEEWVKENISEERVVMR